MNSACSRSSRADDTMMERSVLEGSEVGNSSVLNPAVSSEEASDGVLKSLIPADDPETLPLDPPVSGGTGSAVCVLGVVEGVEGKVSGPWVPPGWVDEV